MEEDINFVFIKNPESFRDFLFCYNQVSQELKNCIKIKTIENEAVFPLHVVFYWGNSVYHFLDDVFH